MSNNFDKVQDSGERRDFDTGSRRDTDKGKGRYDLLCPFSLQRVAVHFENGAAKYGDRNWELGQPMSVFFNSAVRHMFKWAMGKQDEDHLAAAAWNILGMISQEERALADDVKLSHTLWDMPNQDYPGVPF